jgi:hypothetical protein
MARNPTHNGLVRRIGRWSQLVLANAHPSAVGKMPAVPECLLSRRLSRRQPRCAEAPRGAKKFDRLNARSSALSKLWEISWPGLKK